jgi:hypothetical protein
MNPMMGMMGNPMMMMNMMNRMGGNGPAGGNMMPMGMNPMGM